MSLVEIALLALVMPGMLPTFARFAQFLVVGVHGLRYHYARCGDHTPRVAFVLPALDEAQVPGAGIDSPMQLSYPAGAWRIYVVVDASTDATPEVLREKIARYPGSVFHLRREKGGEGKAHTLNHGLKHVLADHWVQAVMVMDADPLFEPTPLHRMTRHLADPQIASVTGPA